MGTDRFDTLFLDRDGVINRLRPKDYVKTWEEFEFISGSVEALRILASRFRYILVVTNQRGVGRGVMTEQDLQTIHDKMLQEIRRGGGRIDRIYVCTALDDRDPDRKPNIGMALKARADFPDLDFTRSIMVNSDIESGRSVYGSVADRIVRNPRSNRCMPLRRVCPSTGRSV